MSKQKAEPRKLCVADAASDAISDLMALGEEMREWADNLEEKFSTTAKYVTVSETADVLENLSEPDFPAVAQDVVVTIVDLSSRKRGHSRAARCGHAAGIIGDCVAALDSWIDAWDADDNGDGVRAELESLREELEEIVAAAEGCEFPGAYG